MPDNLEDIQLRSEEVQEILTRVPHWMIRWGNLLILVLILLLLFLSWMLKYPDTIPAQAIITTEAPLQKEQANVSEKIEAILVKEGDTVPEGTPLAILRNTANYEDVFKLKAIVDTITVSNKSFSFPLDELPTLILGDILTDFATFENSYLDYLLNKRLNPFSNEAIANKNSLSELRLRKQNLIDQKKFSKRELDNKKRDFNRQKVLFEKGRISQQEYEQSESEYYGVERNYKAIDAQISQITESIGNANKTSVNTEINKTKEENNLRLKVLQSFNRLKKSIKDWELRYLLQSDIEGRVSFSNYRFVNQNVTAGDIVFIVIPIQESSSYVAKIKAPTQNSGKIKLGQKANIKLENFPDDEFGMLQGTVDYISMLPDKDGLYLIDVKLPKNLITTYNKEIPFQQEMRGSVEIITEDLRLIERFFYQFRSLMDK
ncbi:HlyD family efflux transporter periplasmic adaptor subunit [Aquimarina sp. MMG015]|uniref:HlyD family secretion protein n=1 Tax=Aquimarina TaxID=290174 RepID=UPI00042942B0|nr:MULTISPECIES: HlyD family efflux transporter periplasmic adaptor subunit [Aquimarina]AXT55944.1 HlyD family efflux transporter periplasmic adaptor subunit [Aquimarina sp. AD1]MBQ4803976.1 HlyD family efflux transporter periplasmic adaptor subunit [Aquimarina sp. MMG015]RKN37699.1 HlyD family efflux transporter periplasmic adaptor subunit [Aquimarina sp. AD1]